MDFKAARKNVGRLLAPKSRPQDLATSALTKDALRNNVVDEATADSPRFRQALNERPQVEYTHTDADGNEANKSFEWSAFGEAIKDVARAGYGYEEPQIAPRETVRPSHQFNRAVLSSFLATDEFRDSRPYTRNNELESLFGALAAAKSLTDSAPGVAEHLARAQEMDEAEAEQQNAEQMLENLRKQNQQAQDATGALDPNIGDLVKREIAKREAAKAKLNDLTQANVGSGAARAAAGVAKAAANEYSDAVEAAGSLPGVGGGQATNLTPDQQIALAEKWANNKDLRAMSKMLGRMIRDMRFKRTARTKNVPIEPVGTTTGRDIPLLLPHELARAYMPALKPVWMKDYAERSLLQYEMSGKTPAGKGPIICVTDGSGSMNGEPFVWASSLALTLLTLAQREKRDFAGVEFGSTGQFKSWVFPGRQTPDANEVVDYASHFFGGGTSILTGMKEAQRIIRDVPAFKTADVVIVSDGQDHYTPDDKAIVDEFKRMGVRVHGISIKCPGNVYLEQACESVVDVIELAGANAATDQLAENIS